MFTDVPALFWAQSERCRTSGWSDQCKPTLLGRGGAWEGPTTRALGFAGEEGGGEFTRAAELECHKWQFGSRTLASERVHCHLRWPFQNIWLPSLVTIPRHFLQCRGVNVPGKCIQWSLSDPMFSLPRLRVVIIGVRMQIYPYQLESARNVGHPISKPAFA